MIYTRTGDKGTTSMLTGKRVSKSSKLIAAIGAIDELNSFLGIVGGLIEIQKDLFSINASLAGSKVDFPYSKTQDLEKKIDKLEGKLPVLKNFIIYGGNKKASELFFARALCRRAERALAALYHSPRFTVDKSLLVYINRLSDYLFMLARAENLKGKIKLKTWALNKK